VTDNSDIDRQFVAPLENLDTIRYDRRV